MSVKKADAKKKARFSKEKLLACKDYNGRRDLLDALLEEGKAYTKKETGKLIDDYLKRSVK